jgi:hypothetical protein
MTASTSTSSPSHSNLGFSTKAIHVGSEPEYSASRGVTPALDLSTTYSQGTIGGTKFEYSRSSNPTRLALERQLAALEGADVLLSENLKKEGLQEEGPAALALGKCVFLFCFARWIMSAELIRFLLYRRQLLEVQQLLRLSKASLEMEDTSFR